MVLYAVCLLDIAGLAHARIFLCTTSMRGNYFKNKDNERSVLLWRPPISMTSHLPIKDTGISLCYAWRADTQLAPRGTIKFVNFLSFSLPPPRSIYSRAAWCLSFTSISRSYYGFVVETLFLFYYTKYSVYSGKHIIVSLHHGYRGVDQYYETEAKIRFFNTWLEFYFNFYSWN